jgi:hypothetical protein
MQRVLATILLVIGCLPAFGQPPLPWTREKVIDLRLYVRDPVRIESYSCTRQGFVAVEVGTRRGAIRAPLWHWRIFDGRLQFRDHQSIREEFTLLSMHRGSLTVRRRSGEIAHFHYEYERKKT